jgi:hypothetical protein
LSAVRKAWLTRADPAIEYPVCGTQLLLPLSHQLPVHQAFRPDYSLNLGRVAGLVSAHHPDATIVTSGQRRRLVGHRPGSTVRLAVASRVTTSSCPTSRSTRRFADVEIAPTYVRTGEPDVGPDGRARWDGPSRGHVRPWTRWRRST